MAIDRTGFWVYTWNMTQTFDKWYADFCTRYAAGLFPSQRFGQAFTNELRAAGKHTQANSLINLVNDPFYHDEIHPDVLAYIERVWNWPQG